MISMTFLRALSRLQSKAHWKHARSYSTPTYPLGFRFWPSYFSTEEQRILLVASLHKLDSTETRQFRRRRKEFMKSETNPRSSNLNDLFAPDHLYDFQKAGYISTFCPLFSSNGIYFLGAFWWCYPWLQRNTSTFMANRRVPHSRSCFESIICAVSRPALRGSNTLVTFSVIRWNSSTCR